MAQIQLGEFSADVILKDIKNVHLSVYPPDGQVRISAPKHMKLDTIRIYAISKLDWIKRQQEKLRNQNRESKREYLERESHYLWGKRYLLTIIEEDQVPFVEQLHHKLILHVRPGATAEKRQAVMDAWYRTKLNQAVEPLIRKWEKRLGIAVQYLTIRKMKTMWGSCSSSTRRIRLNLELAKKPPHCLEYILVHEMLHCIEPTHNARFIALMDQYMPGWRIHRTELNQLPVKQENWKY